MQRFPLRTATLFLILTLMVVLSTLGEAQTLTSQGLTWSVTKGINIVEMDATSIHMAQKEPKDTTEYALATAPLDLTGRPEWRIAFELRLGKRGSAGSGVNITAGGERVLLASGDMWGQQGPGIHLRDQRLVLLTNDSNWHQVQLHYLRGMATVDFDGKEVGKGEVPNPPDMIEVGTRNPNAGQQTEIWVRNLHVIVGSQQPSSQVSSQGLNWSISKGANTVEVNSDSIHINQKEPKDTAEYATASADLNIYQATTWEVGFEVRFGQLRWMGSGVLLRRGTSAVGWVGADGVYKGMGAIIGHDNNKYSKPADDQWHTFRYVSDGTTLAIWHDGAKVGEAACPGVPNTLFIGSWPTSPVAAQQTEIWVRNIHVSKDLQGQQAAANIQNAFSQGPTPAVIEDAFTQGPMTGLWITQLNGGQIVNQSDGLALLPDPAQDNFPFMATRTSAFPSGASWKVAIHFRYPSRGPYGVAFGFREVAAPQKQVCWIHTGSDLKVIHLFLGGSVVDIPKPEAWHDFILENMHGNWTAQVDGQQTLSAAIGQADYELWFGKTGGSFKPWIWTTLCLQSVRIEYMDGPLPDWLASLPKCGPIEAVKRKQPASQPAAPQGASLPPVSKESRLTDIASIFGTSSSTASPASPGKDGHLIVTARDSKVKAPAGTPVEFIPSNPRPDFEPIEVFLSVNGKLLKKQETIPGLSLPAFTVDVPAIAYARVSIVAVDSSEQKEELQSCILNGTDAASGSTASFNLQEEEVKLVCSSQAPAKTYYVFLENQYIGCLKNSHYLFSVRARTLPTGQYRFETITEDAEGFLHLPSENTITIQPRYTLSSFAQQGVFHVEGDKHAIPLHVVRQPGSSIAKSRVYVAGLYVGESKDADFQMQIPLDDVPSGTASIEVVGITKDDASYPPEAIQVQLQNYRLNYQAARGQMDKDLQAKIAQLGQLDQEIVYWYVKGVHEPAFITAVESHTITNVIASDAIAIAGSTTYLHSITVPGPAADDFGHCAAAIMKEAQVHLEIGRLYKALGRFDSARAQFEQVVFEVSEESGVGSAALEELRHL